MKSILPLILLLLSGISSTAGNLSVTFDLSGNPGSEDINITLRPAEDYNPASSVTLARSGTQRTGEIPASPSGLYYLYCYTPQYQTSIPVSLDASSFTAPVKVNVDAGDFVVSTSLAGPVNSALADANSRFVSRSRLIGNKSVEMTGDELRDNLRGFSADADAVISAAKLPAPAQEFIRLWAYTLASDSYSMALYMRSRADKQVTFSVSDILPPPAAILDTPMAAGFPSAMGAVVSTLPGKSLEERLESLHSGYRTQAIKDNVTPMLIESFLSSFDYKNDFESGEARLAALTDRYSLPAKYLAGFRARRATVPGLPFPSGITLLDRDGNTVDFSSFRGKYVSSTFGLHGAVHAARKSPSFRNSKKSSATPMSSSYPSPVTHPRLHGSKRCSSSRCTATSSSTQPATSTASSISAASPTSSSTIPRATSTPTTPHVPPHPRSSPSSAPSNNPQPDS